MKKIIASLSILTIWLLLVSFTDFVYVIEEDEMFYKEKYKKNGKEAETIRYSFVENYSDFCSFDNGDYYRI